MVVVGGYAQSTGFLLKLEEAFLGSATFSVPGSGLSVRGTMSSIPVVLVPATSSLVPWGTEKVFPTVLLTFGVSVYGQVAFFVVTSAVSGSLGGLVGVLSVEVQSSLHAEFAPYNVPLEVHIAPSVLF